MRYRSALLLGVGLALAFSALARPASAMVTLDPKDLSWSTSADGRIRFQARFRNLTRMPSSPVSGEMNSQEFGVYMPDVSRIGAFNVPSLAPDSFFDVFFEVETQLLPPSAREIVPGRPGSNAAGIVVEDGPPCPPDDHWDGNVDVIWSGGGETGQVQKHFGTLQVCPGGGNSYIHIREFLCRAPNGATWTVKNVCPGFTVQLVNEDFTPAPLALPPDWSGWICVSADPTVPVGVECCPQINFDCGGAPATIDLCVTTCQWQKAPPPVPEVPNWVTQADGTVRFQLRWRNPDPQLASEPVQGRMSSQEFGVFVPNHGPIGTFDVPALAPDSFFDVFFEVELPALPPTAREMLPGGPAPLASGVGIETGSVCPPDDHWDGNVDVIWDTPKGPGQVNVHYGTLQVCPGAGNSYIHIKQLLCDVQGGATWSIKDLCPGFESELVNEDFTPAPNPVPPGWTGWICVRAQAGVPVGVECCLKVNFDCGGGLAEIRLCATTCQWQKGPSPVPQVRDWVTQADGTVKFHLRWRNDDPQLRSLPVQGQMNSQEFGVFMPNHGPIGTFEVPSLAPDSFFDVFFEVGLADLPLTARERVPGMRSGLGPLLGPETGPQCEPDDHWDGNVDVEWTTPEGPGEVNAHYGTLQVCPGGGNSYIHIRQLLCDVQGGARWSFKDLCPGFTATLVNEDFTPAPNPVPPGWTGWICVQADPAVSVGAGCCLKLNFNCGGRPAEIVLCATVCCFGKVDVPTQTDVTELGIRAAIPNPTHGSTEITFAVPRAGSVRLEVFDTSGQRVRTLLDGTVGAGIHTVVWEGRGAGGRRLSPGTYFVKLSLGPETAHRKVVLLN